MIEERFGRKPVTGLLLLVGLAIATVSIWAIWSFGIWPTATTVRDLIDGTTDASWAEIRDTLIAVNTVLLIGWLPLAAVAVGVLHWINRRIGKSADEVRDMIADARSVQSETMAEVERVESEIERIRVEVNKVREDSQAENS